MKCHKSKNATYLVNTALTPPAHPPKSLPVNVKQKGHRNQQRRKATSNTRTWTRANIVVQRAYGQREPTRKTRTQECIRRDSRRSILRERVHEVIQRTLEDGEESGREQHKADTRHDPVDGRIRGPADHELSAGEQEAA